MRLPQGRRGSPSALRRGPRGNLGLLRLALLRMALLLSLSFDDWNKHPGVGVASAIGEGCVCDQFDGELPQHRTPPQVVTSACCR